MDINWSLDTDDNVTFEWFMPGVKGVHQRIVPILPVAAGEYGYFNSTTQGRVEHTFKELCKAEGLKMPIKSGVINW